MAKNMVIDGDYKGKYLKVAKAGFGKGNCAAIARGGFKGDLLIIPENVAGYEIVTENHHKSAASGIAKGLVGGALFGGVGLLAGGVSGKSKGTYNIVIAFTDGRNSLLEVDDNYCNLITGKLALARTAVPEQPSQAIEAAPSQPSQQPYSTADELMKFKKLLDDGVITKKEFEKKKKQLMK